MDLSNVTITETVQEFISSLASCYTLRKIPKYRVGKEIFLVIGYKIPIIERQGINVVYSFEIFKAPNIYYIKIDWNKAEAFSTLEELQFLLEKFRLDYHLLKEYEYMIKDVLE